MATSRKVINAWCTYDWANSAYNLVITSTIFPAYFEAVTRNPDNNNMVEFLGRSFVNTALYNYALGAAFIIVALISPVLTAIADSRGNKKNFMWFFCLIGSMACAGLYFFAPHQGEEGEVVLSSGALHIGMLCMSLSCIGFWCSLVFYNSYLPDLVPKQFRDRVSARGFTWGYIGSVLLQAICFLIVFFPESFGLRTTFEQQYMPARISFVLVACWWFGFALIPFYYLPKGQARPEARRVSVWRAGFSELHKVWAQVRTRLVLRRFLYAFFWYSAGIQTVFLAATPFGAKVLQLSTTKLILTIMIIQLVAIPGAILISRISEAIGSLRTLTGVVLVWVLICAAGYFVQTDIQFYLLGALVGLVMGGIQAISRSTYANLMPPTEDTASFFSFYDVTEKVALVLGMFSFAYLEELTGSMRNSILALMVFFLLGMILLIRTHQAYRKTAAAGAGN